MPKLRALVSEFPLTSSTTTGFLPRHLRSSMTRFARLYSPILNSRLAFAVVACATSSTLIPRNSAIFSTT